jgi:plastocyanin
MRRLVTICGFALLVTAPAALASGDAPTRAAPAAAQFFGDIQIDIDWRENPLARTARYEYSPSHIELVAGTTITWTNRTALTHTVTAGAFNSGDIPPGGQFHFTSISGYYPYHCDYHESMIGAIQAYAPPMIG